MTNTQIPDAPTGWVKGMKELWTQIWSGNPHLVYERDALSVQILCEIYGEYQAVKKLSSFAANASDSQKLKKRVHENANGTLQNHPLVTQTSELRKELRIYISALGLSPLDSSKIDIEDFAKSKRQAEITQMADRAAILKG